jgi:hypothetical protein
MKKILIIILLFIAFKGIAQELITPLSYNPAYRNAQNNIAQNKTNTKGGNTVVKLPFFDDFSRQGIYPYHDLWENNFVFINNSYAVNPPSFGVATFDAMNDTGAVYSHMSGFPSIADTLTSVSIRLDSLFATNSTLSPADSLYLSFYIQPQGLGDSPQKGDSIVLQFYAQKIGIWKSVWHMEGMPLDTLKAIYGKDFLQVMIPITDTIYFGPNFKFRFYNYASIPGIQIPSWRSGVYDHWNLDYVYLDANRYQDSIYSKDIAVSANITTLLTNYQSMPWNQFKAKASSEMDHSIGFSYNKLFKPTISANVAQFFGIQNLDDKTYFHPNPNPASVNMVTPSLTFSPNYNSYTYHSNASPYADFQVVFSVYGKPDINRYNDTLKFFQRFYNYYAYDDGIPEAGYGLSTSNGRLAIQFKVNVPDSIQSIQFYFNQTMGLSSQQYFYLTIWSDNNGTPGSIIYEQKNIRPEYENKLFKFHTYKLDHAVAVTGTFYVGWRQTTNDNLNVGWDRNNNKKLQVFYNASGTWYNSSFDGCTMIRPIMGTEDEAYLGVSNTKKQNNLDLIIAPNPIEGSHLNLILKTEDPFIDSYLIRIYNINGQLVKETAYAQHIDLGGFQSGIYFIQLLNNNGSIEASKKFIINN